MYQRMTAVLCVLTFVLFLGSNRSEERDIWADRVSAEMLDPAPPVSTIDLEARKVKPVGKPSGKKFETADRLGEYIPGPTLPPAGLDGLPFYAGESDGIFERRCQGLPECEARCEEMQFYRIQAGLPDIFDRMGFGESSCKNTIENSCCHGYFQIHELYWYNVPQCGVTNIYDLQGDEPIKKQRNACVAKVVYDTSGCGAWTTCPF